ncbi:hypothetical protein HPB51_019442 [Rhipicephalus microplus]|uniref:Uncharacterized protein n=1 Tax=Rhipicephalus microplus TaxID=6941 RepID=A0A9J6DNU6_RHIMP|nr:hypothetical protein HPB51_019442 [Rhipicephalus microplus]
MLTVAPRGEPPGRFSRAASGAASTVRDFKRLHFLESDFRGDTKRRMLKQGSLPSVFPSYPSCHWPIPPRPRSDTSIAKSKREPSPVKKSSLSAYTRSPDGDLRTEPSVVDSATVDCMDATAPETAAADAVTARFGISGLTSEFLEDRQQPEASNVPLLVPTACAMRSFGTQTNGSNSSAAYLQKKKCARKKKV